MAIPTPLKTAVLWCGRLLLGGTFLYAATLKIMNPAAFVADIDHYRLLPYPGAVVLGVYLPWIEVVCGLAVVLRWRERGALALLLALCMVFSVALASAWIRGLDINCGCFGHGATANLHQALARSLILGVVALYLFRSSLQTKACPAPLQPAG
ncbi:MAG: DoxX family membrane protein [Lacunisphaera sp.]|nr:DoxX family membrane protein [Lacunisphaera sp.]